ncbi:hypothetical protein PPL_03745 [Heterostelium album PN500]|uniref:AP complex subunit sigma n=1 Tax=Heterostelium pallidum (strain ATCC 26659 / Pp 5 / PN500) TaxID=670386 RepID=D3B6J7_HETP5|nr:hypothetical protein PPL_03745 [Heterostelium album PN500]EFA82967.1 hypothetical protein PPL_03745 [Heterostelium album PN500]|eukprot:XP_020435084.1 hypothetical protein PPL_03745 [Heterostelium album PN500]
MIHFFLTFNRQGKMRLSRWYSTYSPKEKSRFTKEIAGQVLRRREKDYNNDNELITLELIHRYVVILDMVFENICEMDLIYEFEKAYCLLDEYILGGEMQESGLLEVVNSLTGGEKWEKAIN